MSIIRSCVLSSSLSLSCVSVEIHRLSAVYICQFIFHESVSLFREEGITEDKSLLEVTEIKQKSLWILKFDKWAVKPLWRLPAVRNIVAAGEGKGGASVPGQTSQSSESTSPPPPSFFFSSSLFSISCLSSSSLLFPSSSSVASSAASHSFLLLSLKPRLEMY